MAFADELRNIQPVDREADKESERKSRLRECMRKTLDLFKEKCKKTQVMVVNPIQEKPRMKTHIMSIIKITIWSYSIMI